MALLGSVLQLIWIKIASVYNQYIWKWGLDFSLNPITLIYLEAWEVALSLSLYIFWAPETGVRPQ